VKTSGCSGLAYVLEFVDSIDAHDTTFEQFGVKVFVDPKAWFISMVWRWTT
jgi:iron-sulfur cluster assembly protein